MSMEYGDKKIWEKKIDGIDLGTTYENIKMQCVVKNVFFGIGKCI